MGFDFSEIKYKILRAVEAFVKLFSEMLENIKPIKKIKYDPVKKIVPNKVILLNKRFNMYYCRNNC